MPTYVPPQRRGAGAGPAEDDSSRDAPRGNDRFSSLKEDGPPPSRGGKGEGRGDRDDRGDNGDRGDRGDREGPPARQSSEERRAMIAQWNAEREGQPGVVA
uniref:Uncharacterized protein n=1 Tax=Alexandrium catenella TaxID=2925 RepID=A0A7S1LX28_ALECA